jgi:hypothetical protein
MRRKLRGLVIMAISLLCAVVPALAHHSLAAEFDESKEFTVTGVLSKIEWTNPHIYYYVDVKNPETGKAESWAFEGHPPGMAHRGGITKDMFKVGETVTVTGVPPKDGSKHLGYGKRLKYLSDGHEIVMWTTLRDQP